MKTYIGIDCGSVSIKFALVNNGQLVDTVYLKNQGLISTLQEGLSRLSLDSIAGVGITGSGKEFASKLVGADYIDSEVIAHMVACQRQYPDVATIIDIGGEDSKLMLIRDGILSGFQMNKDCGGGTGSMIETIAARLGVDIEDVGDIALKSSNKVVLPGKCGIFCQSAVVSELNKGRPIADILFGVCRALVGNYLAVLAKGKKLLPPIVFQGTTALNSALVRCFEEELDSEVLVPSDCSFMGAIGIALMAEENMNGKATNFRGHNILNSNFTTSLTRCEDCGNMCELLSLLADGKVLGISGSRCEKYLKAAHGTEIPSGDHCQQ